MLLMAFFHFRFWNEKRHHIIHQLDFWPKKNVPIFLAPPSFLLLLLICIPDHLDQASPPPPPAVLFYFRSKFHDSSHWFDQQIISWYPTAHFQSFSSRVKKFKKKGFNFYAQQGVNQDIRVLHLASYRFYMNDDIFSLEKLILGSKRLESILFVNL